jgi:hypothetical protein
MGAMSMVLGCIGRAQQGHALGAALTSAASTSLPTSSPSCNKHRPEHVSCCSGEQRAGCMHKQRLCPDV